MEEYMKITGNGCEISKYINQAALRPGKEEAGKSPTQGNIPPESTRDAIVNLSEASREVQKAREAIDSEPDIRLEKVREMQQEIEKGAYEVDYDKTAEKMLGYFIDEMG
jgi:flagellar biosynthesis anti-sigma factor FlgM